MRLPLAYLSLIRGGLIVALLAAVGCRRSSEDYAADARFYKSLGLEKLFNADKPPRVAIRQLDSVYASLKSVSDYGRYFRYTKKYDYAVFTGDSRAMNLYADSAFTILTKDGLSRYYPEEFALTLLRKGNASFALHDYNGAYDYYFRAKEFARQQLDSCKQNDFSYSIAMTLYRQQRFKSAATYFKQSYRQASHPCVKEKPVWRMQEILNNIALCYTKLERPDSAMLYYRKGLKFIDDQENGMISLNYVSKARAVIKGNMAKIYIHSGKLDSAKALLVESISVNTGPGGDYRDGQLSQVQLAEVYLVEKRFGAMRSVLADLEKGFTTSPNPDAQAACKRLLSVYYRHTGAYARALDYYHAYILARDSIDEANRRTLRTDVIEQLRSKDQLSQINLLKKDNELKKIYLWVTLLLIGFTLSIIALVYVNYKKTRGNVELLTGLNARINEQKSALEKAGKEKDRIMDVVAHDLRSPVGITSFVADSMLMMENNSPEHIERLGMIKQASRQALSLIHMLLGLRVSDMSGQVMERTDLNVRVERLVKLLQFKADEKEQTIAFSPAAAAVCVWMVPESMDRLIDNLVSNAIKFSKPGGEISIGLHKNNETAFIRVKDRGIGISTELLPDLFEQATRNRKPGTEGERSFGLGLSICRQIARDHGGEITVDSRLGEGSVFEITLPLSE